MFSKVIPAGKIKLLRTSFYGKLTFYIVLIAILPIFIVGTLSYIHVKNALENEMSVWNTYVLENSKQSFETIVNQMFYQASYLTTSNITNDYEKLNNALTYENAPVNSLRQDLNGLNEYLFFKKNMIKLMSSLKINTKYIDDIYFYDNEKDMILTSDGRQYNKKSFYDQAWYDTFDDNKDFFTRMDLRTINMSGINHDILTLIYRTMNKSNAFVVNINVSELYNSTIRNLSSHQDYYYVYSSEAGKLIGQGSERTDSMLDELGGIEAIIGNQPDNKLMYDQYLLSWVKSERLGWYFISIKDLKGYYTDVQKARNLMLLSSGLILLLFVILSSYVSNRIYTPLKKLTQLIQSRSSHADSHKIVDEIGYIERRFETVYNEKYNIQSKYDENLPALRQLFKYDWIKHGLYARAEIEAKLDDLEIDMPLGNFAVLLVQGENGPSSQARDIFERILYEHHQGFGVDIDNQLCLVVHIEESGINRLYMLIQQAIDEIKVVDASPVTVGVGGFCHDVAEINRSYGEAAEALKYRIVYGSEEIFFFDDIKLSHKSRYSYPVEKEKALNNCIITGDQQGALHIVKMMIDDFTDPKHALSYRKLQQSLHMLLSGIMKTIDMLGLDIDDVLGRQTDYFELIDRNSNKQELLEQCSELLVNIMKYVSVEKTNKNNKDMNKIIDFIERNYAKPITLVDAAGVVGFNPSYVSRLIKNCTGKSFTDYLADKRIRKAEQLLLDTDLKVDNISREVGYHNTYYFIRVFRKYFGTTPSKYRQSQTGASDEPMEM